MLLSTLALLAGLLAGFVNALAGSGSLLTLPALLLLGLDLHGANATNRVGVLLAAAAAVIQFHRRGRLPTAGLAWIAPPAIAGGLLGALVAARLPERPLTIVFGICFVALLVVMTRTPKASIRTTDAARQPGVVTALLFFVTGVYGGFLQAGVGLLLLAILTLHLGRPLVDANGVKNLLALLFTLPAVLVFAHQGQIDWSIALLVAAGQITGAVIASRFATNARTADLWIRRLVLLALAATAAKLLFDLL